MLPRLIAVLVLIFAVIGIASAFKRAQRQKELSKKREKQTFRPQAAPTSDDKPSPKPHNGSSTDVVMMSKTEAKKRRDALTGNPIDPAARVWQCDQCESMYQEASAQAIERDSGGHCLQCGHTHRSLVAFTDP